MVVKLSRTATEQNAGARVNSELKERTGTDILLLFFRLERNRTEHIERRHASRAELKILYAGMQNANFSA